MDVLMNHCELHMESKVLNTILRRSLGAKEIQQEKKNIPRSHPYIIPDRTRSCSPRAEALQYS